MGSAPPIPTYHNGREEAAIMSSLKLLAIALSVAGLTACTPEKVLNSIVAADSGHNLIGYEPAEEDEPTTNPPQAATPNPISSSSEYVPPPEPPKEPCTTQTRVYWCIDGFKEYI